MNLLTDEEFLKISKYISDNLGLHFAQDRQSDLERELTRTAQQAGFDNLKSYVKFLLETSPQKNYINLLAVNLTIGETYFFRESRIFDILKQNIFKELLDSRQKIRIWSAGCCTGEEPYSIAMTVDEVFPKNRKKDVTILATDINTEFLRRASEGVYSQWSFRGVSEEIKRKYFVRIDNKRYRINNQIKEMVKFKYLNLVEDLYPSVLNETNAMDVIFCRNVLLYFNLGGIKRVTESFYNSLTDEGWLIPGMSELSHINNAKLKSIHFNDAILYRKTMKELNTKELKTDRPVFSTDPASFPAKNQGKSLRQKPRVESKQSRTKIYSFKLAEELYNSGDYIGAAEQLENLFENNLLLKSETDEAYIMLSKSYANLGNIKKAKEWCEMGLEFNRLNSMLFLLLCNLLQEEGKIDEAIEAARKAIYLDPEYIMAHFTLANIFRRLNNKNEVARYMNSALDILNKMEDFEIIRGSEGLSAGRLKNVILSFLSENS